jgi:hypothetical protein
MKAPYDPIPDFEPERDFHKTPVQHPWAGFVGICIWIAAACVCVALVTKAVVLP